VLALLADRDADTRRMYAEYLKFHSWDVEEATDGREALAKVLSLNPAIVVTETRLPGISGFDLCELLRRDLATRAVPILVVTGDGYPADIQRMRDAGADSVLVKPCLPEALLVEARRLIQMSLRLRSRSAAIRGRAEKQQARSADVPVRSSGTARTLAFNHAHERRDTTSPPIQPPPLFCPRCNRPLTYQRSHLGGVSARHPEQWDYFECPGACGTFQYRERTRKLRKVI
jgi:DNA-binding response OmpR family regulator